MLFVGSFFTKSGAIAFIFLLKNKAARQQYQETEEDEDIF
jgi:hypothetical protein